MSEQQNDTRDTRIEGGEIQTPFLKKLENFWYHYKWHSLIALFLVGVIVVCSLQIFRKERYDCYLVYAGPATIGTTTEESTISVFDITATLSRIMEDYNGDGEKNVSLERYWIPSAADLNLSEGDTGSGQLMNNIVANKNAFSTELQGGEGIIFLVSPAIFESMDAIEEDVEGGGTTKLLMSLFSVDPEVDTTAFYRYKNGTVSDYGIYLKDLPISRQPGFAELCRKYPDTVLCIRNTNSMIKWLNGNKEELRAIHEHHEKLVAAMLAFGRPANQES